MRKLGWLLLAALSFQAAAEARLEDPIARPCYMCNASEMYAHAESLGVGEHYVYNGASVTNIQGFRVTNEGGQMVATHFAPPAWIRTQYNELMKLYDSSRGVFYDEWGTINLQPPGSPHVRNDNVMWGHHLSDLNPRHPEARDIVQRFLSRTSRFDYLKADAEHGRILRFESQLDGASPLIVRLKVYLSELGYMEFFFDHENRRWEYLRSADANLVLQEKPEDFLRSDGSPRRLVYRRGLLPYFWQRAEWAGIEVSGTPAPGGTDVGYLCGRTAGNIRCELN